MKKHFNKKLGFTLVELLIATGLLSLVILSAFSLSTSSNKSFEAGSWRIGRQKAAQLFLLRFKDTLERVNHANAVSSNGTTTRVGGSRDIVVAAPWYNKVASTTNSGILFGSITEPFIEANPELGTDEVRGIWKGVGLECFNKTLSLYQTGDWNSMLTSTPVIVGSADLGRFVMNDRSGDFVTELQDVDSVGVFVRLATDSVALNRPELLLTLQVKMVHPKSKGQSSITEEMTVRILDRIESEVVMGGNTYDTTRRRKN
jgi:Tfp pilus assembly protein PilE